MTIEDVFEAAKALEPEEEGRWFNFIVLDISVENRNSTSSTSICKLSGLIRFIDLRMNSKNSKPIMLIKIF